MDNARPSPASRWSSSASSSRFPSCAQILSEGGAHVIKVESVDGDPVRQLAPLAPGETRQLHLPNRGKHSLRSTSAIVRPARRRPPPGPRRRRAHELPPGLAAELGLDWASLAPRHPRLVVGNVSAFGRRGPAARLAGMDLVVQARSGLMAAGGNIQDGVPTAAKTRWSITCAR